MNYLLLNVVFQLNSKPILRLCLHFSLFWRQEFTLEGCPTIWHTLCMGCKAEARQNSAGTKDESTACTQWLNIFTISDYIIILPTMDLTPILSLSQQTCLLLNADSLTSVLNRWKYTSHLMCVAVYLFCTLFISNLNCRMLRRAASFPSSYIPSRFSLSNISHFLLGQNAYHNFKI